MENHQEYTRVTGSKAIVNDGCVEREFEVQGSADDSLHNLISCCVTRCTGQFLSHTSSSAAP